MVFAGHRPDHGNGYDVCRIAMISTMRTARPTTGSPLSIFEAGTAPFDPASSCFCFFSRLDPADPFIARERRNIFPCLQRFCVGGQCLFQIRGQVMDHTAWELFFAQSFAHKCIALAERTGFEPSERSRAQRFSSSGSLIPLRALPRPIYGVTGDHGFGLIGLI